MRLFAKNFIKTTACKAVFIAMMGSFISSSAMAQTLLNVSYDPTRELYKEYNQLFEKHWQSLTGDTSLAVKTSHGGSGKQARAVIDGLQADVVTLALSSDIDALNRNQQLIDPNWQKRLANNSSPYTSTIVFLVRKGNPHQILDWQDLLKEGVEVITPNPKTSGGARWNFFAVWVYGKTAFGSDEKALEFTTNVYRQVPVLNTGARGATMSFIQRGLGDVLLTWENEAHLALKEEGGENVEIVVPPTSILAEPPVAVVDRVVDKKGTRQAAEAYVKHLYSDEAQHIIAKNHYRPANQAILEQYREQFPALNLRTLDEVFGENSLQIQARFFDDGGIFDQILEKIYQ
ncbi:sulfate ABC transporter substrate-binding protein [Mannheimia varigena]|uniref:sulfate ABC transporter substrate-binding protein n=1 Tax=Mannheimia varigena TaxID=85404 RepID=UPI0003E3F6A1|nr:sulfate ABC transporter substrate-binding protein [Mannheimia varigena]AHG77766.1 Sulfate ABC transporter, periplasmic sulfate-binding protein [Mannheimia varigena USDA-ARS-USMARC-1312]